MSRPYPIARKQIGTSELQFSRFPQLNRIAYLVDEAHPLRVDCPAHGCEVKTIGERTYAFTHPQYIAHPDTEDLQEILLQCLWSRVSTDQACTQRRDLAWTCLLFCEQTGVHEWQTDERGTAVTFDQVERLIRIEAVHQDTGDIGEESCQRGEETSGMHHRRRDQHDVVRPQCDRLKCPHDFIQRARSMSDQLRFTCRSGSG